MKFNSKNPETWIDRETFALYCGEGSEKLLTFYDKAVENKNTMTISANWGAILFLPFWLGFRRQWAFYLSLMFGFSVLPFIEAYLSRSIGGTSGALLVLGIFSNGYMLSYVSKRYLKLKAQNLSLSDIQSQLKNKGSKSWFMCFLAGLGMFVAILIMYTLAENFIGPIPD